MELVGYNKDNNYTFLWNRKWFLKKNMMFSYEDTGTQNVKLVEKYLSNYLELEKLHGNLSGGSIVPVILAMQPSAVDQEQDQ